MNTIKNIRILWFIPLLVFSFCSSKPGETKTNAEQQQTTGQKFKIKGKLSNYAVPQLVLNELTPTGIVPIDTSEVDAAGNFSFEGFVREKIFALINLGQYRNVFLIIDTTSEMQVNIDGGPVVTYTVTGSPESDEIRKIADINASYNKKIQDLDAEFQRDPTMAPERQQAIEGQVNQLVEELKDRMAQAVAASNSPLAQLFAIELLQVNADAKTEEGLIAVAEKNKGSKWYDYYRPRAQARVATAIGSQAPDIMLKDTAGNTMALSSLKGKYVMIDFWASWCRPCRAENPNVVRVYNMYKSKGFEIFGVSLDQDKNAWLNAIKADGLTWAHVSDLAGWQSSAAKLYSVTSIPQTVLLDKEGRIIAKGLRGAQLEAKLKTLLK